MEYFDYHLLRIELESQDFMPLDDLKEQCIYNAIDRLNIIDYDSDALFRIVRYAKWNYIRKKNKHTYSKLGLRQD